MDAAKLNDWLQVIGFFGVIASLIFVGFEIKQAHEIALSEAYPDLKANQNMAQLTEEITSTENKIGFANANAVAML